MRTYCVEGRNVCIDYENLCVGVHPCFYVYAVYTGLDVCVEAGCQFGCPRSLCPPYFGGQVLSMKLELTHLDSI